ncbi:MAG TPA: S9 family peptidase [Candidatus Eisenbacteria bacterium]|nr:S9 family peptidase [Candidatus Eisenbacteria bacterium]
MTEMTTAQERTATPEPPVARKVPRVETLHGDRRVDDYFWLRQKSDPEVIRYLEAENAYTTEMSRGTEPFQETLYKEMLARIKQTDLSVPYRLRGYYYYSRTEEGKQYPIQCRKKGSLEAPEEVVLDLNELAKGHAFLGLGAYTVSDDDQRLAFSLDTTGFRQYTLHVKDLTTGQWGPERVDEVGSVVWAADNATLFYTVEDPAKRQYRLYRHTLGAPHDGDVLVYEEKDERFELDARRSLSRAYIFLETESHTASEVRVLPADRPADAFRLIAAREKDHEYYIEHHGDRFFIRTNQGAPNFRLVSAPVADPGKAHWTEVLPHRKDVMLSGMTFFANHYVLVEREGGLPQLRITDFRSGASHRIAFPEPVYSATSGANPEYETTTFRYGYQSFITPSSIYDYDMDSRDAKLLKRTEVLGGFDPSRYESERLWATASDGTRIPISVVYRKGLAHDGSAPMLLNGYGSYGISQNATFNSNRLSLIDRGVVFAIAHVRGGGEMGKPWHEQGRMMHKKTTFTDFIAVAEHLIAQKYTARDRLVIQGGSAGGLLMGAVTNMRPDLFKAVIAEVPFVDVINTMNDASLPLTVGEFEEWGNPKIKAEYDYIKTYCPYTNTIAKAYPSMLVKTSLNDSQVMYWEPAKWVAKLRALKTDRNPLLFRINMGAGHGGSSGRYDALREVAFNYAFILSQFAIRS